MRPALLSEPANGLAALVLATIIGSQRPPPASVMPVTVGLDIVEAAPPPPVLVRTGPALDSVDTSPQAAVFSAAGGFTFDTSRIRAHRSILFPFLTGELTFLNQLRQSAEADRQRLHNPLGAIAGRVSVPIVDLIARFDDDDGDLPKVVRGHVERNLLQPYNESVAPDPRFWSVLSLAADHVDVLEFVGRHVREHPSSRTTTELLFLLDELTQASSNAWDILMDTNVDDLTVTRGVSTANVALARQLQRGYQQWARDHAADMPQARDARYDGVRPAILTTIIDTSPNGYGASDARFLAGRRLWDRGDLAGAIRMWREMGNDERQTYAEARAGMERGLRESAERLARFGYTPVTF